MIVKRRILKKKVTNNFSSTIDWVSVTKKLIEDAPEPTYDKIAFETPVQKIKALLSIGAEKQASIKLKEYYLINKADYIKEFGDPTKI